MDFEGRCLPRFPPPLPFFLFDVQDVDCVFDGVDGDDVAVFDECDRTSDLSFGYDVADDETVRSGWFFFGTIWKKTKEKTHPPLKRPSVIQATSKPRPAPMIKLVGFSISGIPKVKFKKLVS